MGAGDQLMHDLNFNPRRNSARRNAVIWTIFCFLLGGAFWYSLTGTLDRMTERDCAAGVQKACKALQPKN